MNKQPIVKHPKTDGSTLLVNEIFYSIQGEGPFSGCPAIFVRMQGCNLRCFWCDTEYTKGHEWEVTDLFDEIIELYLRNGSNPIVVITGGEPMLQNLNMLLELLAGFGITVQIETNGTAVPDDFPWRNENLHIVVSPKTGKLHKNLDLYAVSAWKYVLDINTERSVHDSLPIMSTQAPNVKIELARAPAGFPVNQIYVSPMDNLNLKDNMKLCAEVAMKRGYVVSLQTHKILEVE